jgi:hypothetical protein
MEQAREGKEIATLAGGCFWCLEAVYDRLQGVESVESGYMGGQRPDPTYEAVCNGDTGHAEVVRVTFDPKVLSYRDLLEVFFVIHDPTTPNRPVSLGDFLSHASAESRGGANRKRTCPGKGFYGPDCYRNRAGRTVLHRRALSPGLLPEQSEPAVLPLRGGAEGGQVQGEVRRQTEEVASLNRLVSPGCFCIGGCCIKVPA